MVKLYATHATHLLLLLLLHLPSLAASSPHTDADNRCLAPSAMGCFVDPYVASNHTRRVLNTSVAAHDTAMTQERCVGLCCAAGFGAGSLAGVEGGSACWCDHNFGPYDIPEDPSGCVTPCSGSSTEQCGGPGRIRVLGITSCPPLPPLASSVPPSFLLPVTSPHSPLKVCGANGCTTCPAGDTCCVGKSPDPYRVPGGYGCAPPHSANTTGCAGGGTFPGGCCCAPGPALVSKTIPNVLIIGDSVSAGYVLYAAQPSCAVVGRS